MKIRRFRQLMTSLKPSALPEDVEARSMIEFVREGTCGWEADEYKKAIDKLTDVALSIVRAQWDATYAEIDNQKFLHPPANATGDRIWNEEIREMVQSCIVRMYNALHDPRDDLYERLASQFSAVLTRLARRHIDHQSSQSRGRVTQTVDGSEGPERKRVYTDRAVSVQDDLFDKSAYSDYIADEQDKETAQHCQEIVEKAYRIAPWTDRRTLNDRGRGASAEEAGAHVGTSGQTVINRQRKLVMSVDPHVRDRLRSPRKTRGSRKRGPEHPSGQVLGGAVSSPKQEPGE